MKQTDGYMAALLRLLCEMCGADDARIRVSSDGGEPGVIIDERIGADAAAARETGVCRRQMPLIEEEGSREYQAPALRGSPPFRGGWDLAGGNGSDRWLFRGRIDGFSVEVALGIAPHRAGFLNERLLRAAAFLPFIESVLDDRGVPRSVLPDAREIGAPFNPPLIGSASAMVELRRLVRLVAPSDLSILIEGESGAGKEVVARNLHRLGRRSLKPLVAVSCAELPGALLQSELFGHAEGAFTGASRDRAGLVESAAGGTFFLDEIGEMPLPLQAALLRVLQEKEVRRLGESRRRTVDVRFVFATNRDLSDLMRRGRFRRDLYYRICGMRLAVPPLRERREDIVPLASHFLALAVHPGGARAPSFSLEAARRLVAHGWPGNVRELRNEMERLAALHGGMRIIDAPMLSHHVALGHAAEPDADCPGNGSLPAAIGRLERRMIEAALSRWSGNRTKASESLGITRQGLLKKIKRHGLLNR